MTIQSRLRYARRVLLLAGAALALTAGALASAVTGAGSVGECGPRFEDVGVDGDAAADRGAIMPSIFAPSSIQRRISEMRSRSTAPSGGGGPGRSS